MQADKKHKYIEGTIYSTIWLAVFLFIVFLSLRNDEIQWFKVLLNLVAMTPFALIFFVNNFWLTPRFLFRKKYLWYFGIASVFVIALSHPTVTSELKDLVQTQRTTDNKLLPNQPSANMPGSMNRPRIGGNLEPMRPGMQPQARKQMVGYLNNILLCILVIGFNTAVKQAGRLIREERLRHQLSEEKLQAELSFLKHQISPHFLMNTLNNIHALVDIDPADAQGSIVKLSQMLRYLLYEKEDKKTSLAKEIEFIESYTDLMKMRYANDLTVNLDFPEQIPQVSIPPFIFITILENAFKHGAAAVKQCFIELKVTVENKHLVVSCSNCKKNQVTTGKIESSGIGLENTKKRLDLYYGNNYIWNIDNLDNKYTSTIKLPLYDN